MARTAHLATVAIVGRPNVGKSSLFNRMIGQRKSIVAPQSGVTRDRIYGTVQHGQGSFSLVDTAGLLFDNESLAQDMRSQVELAIAEAQQIVLVVDFAAGVLPYETDIVQMLRASHKPVHLVVNKVDSEQQLQQSAHLADFAALAAYSSGSALAVSALHGRGISELLQRFCASGLKLLANSEQEVLNLAIVGRPNVGKSSLINRLLHSPRLVVSDQAGTTRDAIDVQLKRKGTVFRLIDTAGLRYQRKVRSGLERLSVRRTEKSIAQADVVALIVSAQEALTTLDLKIMQLITTHKKAAFVLINKWDLFPGIDQKDFVKAVAQRWKMYAHVPYLFTSALTGRNVQKLLDCAVDLDREQQQRVSTGLLNRFIQKIVQSTPPPRKAGKLIKFYYASQVDRVPPQFIFVVNQPRAIPESYRRYLENSLRSQFGFSGVPLVLSFRSRDTSTVPRSSKPRKKDA